MVIKFKNGESYSTSLYRIDGVFKSSMENVSYHRIGTISDLYHLNNIKFIEIGFNEGNKIIKSYPYHEIQELIP